MDVNSGRIYLPDEFAKRQEAAEAGERIDEHQAEFEQRLAEAKIVPVSEDVALRQLAGQAHEAKRKLRKAQKAARKRNRARRS